MIKLNIRMELKTKKTKTGPLLITTGLISPNFGHLYQTCLSSRQLLYGFFYPQWCETGLGCDSFTQLEQDASCSMRSNMLRTHLESMTSPLMLLRTTSVAQIHHHAVKLILPQHSRQQHMKERMLYESTHRSEGFALQPRFIWCQAELWAAHWNEWQSTKVLSFMCGNDLGEKGVQQGSRDKQ